MAWYDEPAKYYRDVQPEEPLTQGDIVIAPTTIIYEGTAESDITGPSDLDQRRRTTLWVSVKEELPAAPTFSAETRWGVAMVIPHPCAMEKEWNERVADLVNSGVPEPQAIDEATSADLDPYVTLAPIFGYDSLPRERRRSAQTGSRLGNFPICPSGDLPASFVDFNQMTTMHFSVAPRIRRIRGLSNLALAHLHHSLVMHFAYRGYAGLANIEEAVGHIISDLQVSKRAKGKLVVNLILDNGETLTMESQDVEQRAGGRERAPRA